MEISRRVEPQVREALEAAVKGDRERFYRALGAFPDEPTAQEGMRLAGAIGLFVILNQFNGTPSVHEIRELAEDLAQAHEWSEVTPQEFEAGLTELITGVGDDAIEGEAAIQVPFLAAAFLLASAVEPPKWWWQYLDEVEAALERQ